MKIFVAHASNFDFIHKLYLPLQNSSLGQKHEFYFPKEKGYETVTKEVIKSCDLILAEVSLPSTGQGIELGWADIFNIPILCISEEGSSISGSLGFVTKKFITYSDSTDMIEKIETFLVKNN
ncbi:MAG: hypothetical protein AAB519_02605 [Patescibacteria group bacterium]